jgi:hypothetical protein
MLKTRHIWLVDRQPAQTRYTGLSDISRSIKIGMEFKPAGSTPKFRSFSVPFISMPAFRTLLRSVPSIYKDDLFTKTLRFVPEELFELIIRPSREFLIELVSSPFLDSYFTKVFQGKDSKSRINNLLRDTMIDISHKPSLSSTYFAEFSPRRSSAFGLQFGSEALEALLHCPDVLRIKEGIIRTHSNINYATINTENRSLFYKFWCLGFDTTMKIKHIIISMERDVGRFYSPCLVFHIITWNAKFCFDASIRSCYSCISGFKIYVNNFLIVPHCRKFFSDWSNLALIAFKGAASTISGALNQGRCKVWYYISNTSISCFMAVDFIRRVIVKPPLRTNIKCYSIISHCFNKRFCRIVAYDKLQFNYSNHIHILVMIGDILDGVDHNLYFHPKSTKKMFGVQL